MQPLLQIEQFTLSFGSLRAVRDLDLHIDAGETLALVGESGCGKSATALAIMGLHGPQAKVQGCIAFEGENLLGVAEKRMRRLRGSAIAMIFQDPMSSLNPVLSVGEQIVETLARHRGLGKAQAQAEAISLLDRVQLPQPRNMLARYPHQLSGGQRQRVMIAIAIACNPRLLIADEPTTALDATVQAEILTLLDALKRELNMALLLITHDLGLVGAWADRVGVMVQGGIVEAGPAGDVLSHPAHAYTRGLLQASLQADDHRHYRMQRLAEIRRQAGTLSDEDHSADIVVVTPPLPASIARAPATRHPDAASPLLSIQELIIRYPQAGATIAPAVNGVSFNLSQGETLGLVGESGCGKTSIAKAVVRLLDPSGGRVEFEGVDLASLSGKALDAHRRDMQLVFQDPHGALNPRQSTYQMLDLVLRVRGNRDRAARLTAIHAALDSVGLPRSALHRYPHEFSGGQRQRIVICRALIQQPRLIVCDEPVSALDVSVQAQILNLLSDLKVSHGLSYLFISHDLGVVRYFTDRTLVMERGQVVDELTFTTSWSPPSSAYTRKLFAAIPGADRAKAIQAA